MNIGEYIGYLISGQEIFHYEDKEKAIICQVNFWAKHVGGRFIRPIKEDVNIRSKLNII